MRQGRASRIPYTIAGFHLTYCPGWYFHTNLADCWKSQVFAQVSKGFAEMECSLLTRFIGIHTWCDLVSDASAQLVILAVARIRGNGIITNWSRKSISYMRSLSDRNNDLLRCTDLTPRMLVISFTGIFPGHSGCMKRGAVMLDEWKGMPRRLVNNHWKSAVAMISAVPSAISKNLIVQEAIYIFD